MKQGTKRLLSMTLALVFIVAAFVVYFEFTQTAYRALEEVRGRREGRARVLSEQKPAVDAAQALIDQYTGEGAGGLPARVSETLPIGPNISAALVQLEGLVRGSGLGLQSLAPQQTRASTLPPVSGGLVRPLGSSVFRLSFTGSYIQVKDFFSRLENNILYFDVHTLSIQPVAKTGAVDFFNVSTEVASYYQQI